MKKFDKKKYAVDPFKNAPLFFDSFTCQDCGRTFRFGTPRIFRCKCEATSKYGKRNKFNACRIIVNGIKFPSLKEGQRYSQLVFVQERLKLIQDLTLQKPFDFRIDGEDLGITWIVDFYYKDLMKGVEVVEDSKGKALPIFKLKLKLFEVLHKGYTIRIL